jgi:hypothetical protein
VTSSQPDLVDKLKEANAEIERLKAANIAYSNEVALLARLGNQKDERIKWLEAEVDQLLPWVDKCSNLVSRNVDLERLITKLADALEGIEATQHWDWTVKLIQEARKAVK